MNILQVTAAYTPFIGGATTFVAEMSRRLAQDGHTVTVLTTDIASIDLTWSPNGKRIEREHDVIDGVAVERFRVGHLPAAPLSFYALRRAMPILSNLAPAMMPTLGKLVPRLFSTAASRRALSRQYDFVHLVNITMESVLHAGAALAAQQRIPMICTPFVHIGEPHVMRNYVMAHQRALMRSSDSVFAQTGRERDALAALDVDAKRVQLLGMGVNPTDASGADGARFRQRHGIDGSAGLVLFMGSITRDKGAVTLLSAMRALWMSGVDVHVAFVGDAPKPGGFADALADVPDPFRPRVHCPGLLSGVDKHDALAACDVFAMPSRVDSFGIVYLEAWLHSKPVIGADAGGVPDVIAHNVDGLIVPFSDADALAMALRAMTDNRAHATALGAAGHAKVLHQFTWDAIYARFRDKLTSMVAAGQ